MEAALENLFADVDEAIADGVNILVLSDRGVGAEACRDSRAAGCVRPAPSSDPHGQTHASDADPGVRRAAEVHHFAVLIGYGASAINPYLGYETLEIMAQEGLLGDIDVRDRASTTIVRR